MCVNLGNLTNYNGTTKLPYQKHHSNYIFCKSVRNEPYENVRKNGKLHTSSIMKICPNNTAKIFNENSLQEKRSNQAFE